MPLPKFITYQTGRKKLVNKVRLTDEPKTKEPEMATRVLNITTLVAAASGGDLLSVSLLSSGALLLLTYVNGSCWFSSMVVSFSISCFIG